MPANATAAARPRLFISYSHTDKAIARRVARRLEAYGVTVWLDERELTVGDVLSPVISEHIAASSGVVVIATSAALDSPWVARELAQAVGASPPKVIYSLLVEAPASHPLLTNHLGLEARDRHRFEGTVLKLAAAIVGDPLPPPSADRLRASLNSVASEKPELSLLIDGCLLGAGLLTSHVETVAQVEFHNLDFAIGALYDVADADKRERIAYAAAALFQRCGVGTYVLETWLRGPRKDGVLRNAVSERLNPAEFDAAIGLLAQGATRDDQSLAGFINRNGAALSAAQQVAAVRLVTSPDRGPAGFSVDAAFAAAKAFPNNNDLHQQWQRWVRNGHFDGLDDGGSDPGKLAFWLGEAVSRGLPDWDHIVDTFLSQVKGLARAKDRDRVEAAVDHLVAATKAKSPLVGRIAEQCESALGAAEWDGWEHAQEMGIYISAHVDAARNGQSRAQADEDYQKEWATTRLMTARRARRQSLRPNQ